MSESKHTKGKWKVAGQGDGNGQLPILANGKIIAAVRNHGSLADAHLIAAAPELLEALKYTIQRIKDIDEWWIEDPDSGFDVDIIESAIAKAIALIL